MTSWAQQIQDFPQPLRAWLIKSYLTQPSNNISILYVNESTYKLINNNFYYLNKIYPVAQEVYSNITSLFILPFTDLVPFIRDGSVSFSHYEKAI